MLQIYGVEGMLLNVARGFQQCEEEGRRVGLHIGLVTSSSMFNLFTDRVLKKLYVRVLVEKAGLQYAGKEGSGR